jgi:hypothetical protein
MTAGDPALSAQSQVFERLCDARKSPWHSACRCGRRCAAHGHAARFETVVCGADRYGGFVRRLPQRAEHRAVLRARQISMDCAPNRAPPRTAWAASGLRSQSYATSCTAGLQPCARSSTAAVRAEMHSSHERLHRLIIRTSLSDRIWMLVLTGTMLAVMAHGFKWI